ncbi:MAG: hypothetical protein QXN55_07590 [Candidatus Nitrosotenuis sp.]
MSTSDLQKKTQTEFEFLLTNSDLTINGIADDENQIPQVLEKKITRAVSDVVNSVLGNNSGKSAQAILQNISSKIPSTIFVRYNRAGKNYVAIEHTMGNLGNLFFSGVVEKSCSGTEYHAIMQQNKISFIFR